jgi:hypothetical protein
VKYLGFIPLVAGVRLDILKQVQDDRVWPSEGNTAPPHSDFASVSKRGNLAEGGKGMGGIKDEILLFVIPDLIRNLSSRRSC